jgi:hypothetical protein
MIKLTNLLTEYNLKVSKDNTYEWDDVNDMHILYRFNIDNDLDKTQYKVIFEKRRNGKYERMYMPETRGNVFKMTGENKAFKINATVMAITLDFLENNKDWLKLIIVPLDSKRHNLVKRFLDTNIPEKYFMEEEDDTFTITRKSYM